MEEAEVVKRLEKLAEQIESDTHFLVCGTDLLRADTLHRRFESAHSRNRKRFFGEIAPGIARDLGISLEKR